MKLTGITRLLARLDPVAESLSEAARQPVYGVLHAAKPALTAAVRESIPGPLLVVTAHPQSAHELAAELASWSERRIAHFGALESLPYERVRLDRVVLAERESVARDLAAGTMEIVVAPVRALLQPVHVSRDANRPMELATGDVISPDDLTRTWVDWGYVSVPLVEEPGTFARRGGVIDIYPADAAAPVRLELFGNEIESIRMFDPASQRSTDPLAATTVAPLAALDATIRLEALEALLNVDITELTAEAQTAWMGDLTRLEAGAPLDELAVFLPYLLGSERSLTELLPAAGCVLIDDAQETFALMHDLSDQAASVQQAMVSSGTLPPGLKPALIHPERLAASLGERRTVEWRSGSGAGSDGIDLSGLFVPSRAYAGRVRSFVRDVVAEPSRRTVVTSYQHERVAELLNEDGVAGRVLSELSGAPDAGVAILPESLPEGWSLPAENLSILTDHELFGRPRIRPVPRRTRPPREAFFVRFEPGDHVVHLEHGIGRFDSITRMSVDGAEREYAVVQYAGQDRVYVPTDQLERLTRYVGVGESPPQLNKLGGGEWQRARQRAKQAAAEIAGELIELYSKRMARQAFAFTPDTPWQHELESSFPYPETPDQVCAVHDVKADMEAPRPMDRLVCADVGYGKTEVAVRAAFKAIMDGKQAAVLVPTTILAQQHHETFCERFAAFPVQVEVLSRFRTPAEQRDILRRVAAGEIDVLIGTHRLLQKDVEFRNLGLLIIDEEQRFGVKHKEQLKRMREAIDVLTLTATPIPRTLHMGLVGIREISVIETPPEGRLPIKTYLQPYEDRLVREAVLRELDREGQVYLVHNKVATIQAMAERIRRLVPEARVVVAHGQMEERELERVMLSFAHQEADVLVCSTIIENGLDIPNVNTIVVNNAHRLGLTQLYQLRGRVGRSSSQAYAYLLYPQDVRMSRDAQRRLEAVFEAQDLGAGMGIAMKDLEIRGVGNLLGAEQSGHATAVGFDLYTRLIGEAVERLRGVPVEERPAVTLDLPITMYLPAEYVASENDRLTFYRRMSLVSSMGELEAISDELRDRFGAQPAPVENLLRSVRLKLAAREARVSSISLGPEALVLRAEPSGLYDRPSLYRKYGSEARISTNVLRVSRYLLGDNWLAAVEEIVADMVRLREGLVARQPVTA